MLQGRQVHGTHYYTAHPGADIAGQLGGAPNTKHAKRGYKNVAFATPNKQHTIAPAPLMPRLCVAVKLARTTRAH